jgi:hypothetical protein
VTELVHLVDSLTAYVGCRLRTIFGGEKRVLTKMLCEEAEELLSVYCWAENVCRISRTVLAFLKHPIGTILFL